MYAMASAAARAIVIQQETQRALTGHEPCLDWIAIPVARLGREILFRPIGLQNALSSTASFADGQFVQSLLKTRLYDGPRFHSLCQRSRQVTGDKEA